MEWRTIGERVRLWELCADGRWLVFVWFKVLKAVTESIAYLWALAKWVGRLQSYVLPKLPLARYKTSPSLSQSPHPPIISSSLLNGIPNIEMYTKADTFGARPSRTSTFAALLFIIRVIPAFVIQLILDRLWRFNI